MNSVSSDVESSVHAVAEHVVAWPRVRRAAIAVGEPCRVVTADIGVDRCRTNSGEGKGGGQPGDRVEGRKGCAWGYFSH